MHAARGCYLAPNSLGSARFISNPSYLVIAWQACPNLIAAICCSKVRSIRETGRLASRIHRLEEFRVVLGVPELVEQEVDRVHGAPRIEDAAKHVHLLQPLRVRDQLSLARARTRNVDRAECAIVGILADQ